MHNARRAPLKILLSEETQYILYFDLKEMYFKRRLLLCQLHLQWCYIHGKIWSQNKWKIHHTINISRPMSRCKHPSPRQLWYHLFPLPLSLWTSYMVTLASCIVQWRILLTSLVEKLDFGFLLVGCLMDSGRDDLSWFQLTWELFCCMLGIWWW